MAAKAFYTGADIGATRPMLLWTDEVAKTANYTVKSSDNGTLFTNTGATGAVTFTLPSTIPFKTSYGFYVTAGQNVTITGSANIVAENNATATNVAFITGGDQIGAFVCVFANAGATLWLTAKLSGNTWTIS